MRWDECKKIAAARTPGEWGWFTYGNVLESRTAEKRYQIIVSANHPEKKDSDFIAMAANKWDKIEKLAEAIKYRIAQCRYEGNFHDELCNCQHAIMPCSCGADQVVKALEELERG